MLSLEHPVAASFATRQLADLGARVIKVERPGTGDFARQYDDLVNGGSSYGHTAGILTELGHDALAFASQPQHGSRS